MSLFSTIWDKLKGLAHATPDADASTQSTTAAPTPDASVTSPGTTAQAAQTVDVAAVLDGLAAKRSEPLNWKTSIVDLMKLLDLDSSLQNRKELAKELNYSGSTDDSAAMNVWLHKEVLKKFAENGGKVPANLAD
jgi:hypothetical protein